MFSSDEAAHNEVKRGRAWASVIFPSNFSESLSKRVDYGANVDNSSIDASEIDIRMDMSSEWKIALTKPSNLHGNKV